MGDRDLSPSPLGLANKLGRGRPCSCGCGRTAQRDKELAWFCDPEIPADLKSKARAKRRKALDRTTADPDLSTPERRQAFREALAGAVLRDEVEPELASIAVRLVDGQAKEDQQRPAMPAAPLIVEVQRFASSNGSEPAS